MITTTYAKQPEKPEEVSTAYLRRIAFLVKMRLLLSELILEFTICYLTFPKKCLIVDKNKAPQ
jgi:hypothetical protein